MNNFDFNYDTGSGISLKLHFNFTQDDELIKEWLGGSTDFLFEVSVEDAYGYWSNYLESHEVTNVNASYSFTATASGDPSDPKEVYGVYFRETDPPITDNYFNRHVGINPDNDGPAGNGLPSYNCGIDSDTIIINENSISWERDGITYSEDFDDPPNAPTTWYTLINALIDKLVGTWPPSGDAFSGELEITFTVRSNIPIFDNFAHIHTYKTSGQTVTNGLLNGYEAPSEASFGRYYINSLVSNNGNITNIRDNYYYKFDGVTNCLGFASEDGVHATLYEFRGGPSIIYKSEDKGVSYDTVNSYPHSYICSSDLTIPAYVLSFKTNIPFFKGDETDSGYDKLRSYITGQESSSGRHYTADDAVNRSEIDAEITGQIGQKVTQTVNGTSSIVFDKGVQLFSLTATQKATFLRDVLSQAKLSDLLDSCKLFGSNQIGALQSLRYLPIDIDDFCTTSSENSCQIGTLTYNFSSSVKGITSNNKMLSMGEQFFRAPYETEDYRNLEPWCRLYCMLPYAGTHALTISKYLNKRVGIKLAVDVTSGACEYHLYANGCEMDAFSGIMGAQIPLTATDKASQVASIQNGIMGMTDGLGQIENTIEASAMAASGNLKTMPNAGGPSSGVKTAHQIISGAKDTYNAFCNAPIATKGSSSGNLGDFGVVSPYFVFAYANSIVPKNELNVVGKPSNQGDIVGRFAGYLKCSAFQLANGFTGTPAEAEMIINQMMEGVYVS